MKTIEFKGMFFLLPSELPPAVADPLLFLSACHLVEDEPDGDLVPLGFFRLMLGQDGFNRLLDGMKDGTIAIEDLPEFCAALYGEYGVIVESAA